MEEDKEMASCPQIAALSIRERLFVLEYCKDLNATQASIRAGYPPTKNTRFGYSLLFTKRIKNAINAKLDQVAKNKEYDINKMFELRRTLLEESMAPGDDHNPAIANMMMNAIETRYLGLTDKVESRNTNLNINMTILLTSKDMERLEELGFVIKLPEQEQTMGEGKIININPDTGDTIDGDFSDTLE